MNSRFKFPCRVRIHGGECGAVARALHHEAKRDALMSYERTLIPRVDPHQADLGKALESTFIERKSMSTKTSLLKRIAQTAVMALAGGLLSFVAAPAANAAVNSSISATCVAREGIGGIINISYKGDSVTTLYAKQVSRTLVTGGSYTLQTDVIQSHTDSSTTTYIMPLSGDTLVAGAATITYLVWADKDGFTADITPATALPDADALSTNVVCTVAGAPASFGWSATTASAKAEETTTVTVTPKDAAGVTTLLNGTTESFTVTATSTASVTVDMRQGVPTNAAKTAFANGSAINGFGSTAAFADYSLTTPAIKGTSFPRTCTTLTGTACRMSFDARFADSAPTRQVGNLTTNGANDSITATGGYTFNVRADGASTVTFTAAGQVTTAAMTSSTFTLTTTAASYGTSYGFTTAALAGEAGYGIVETTEGWEAGAPDLLTAPTAAVPTGGSTGDASFNVSTNRTTIPLVINYTTGATFSYTVAAVTGFPLPTGITAGTYSVTGSSTDSITALSFTTTAPSSGQRFKVTWDKSMGVTTTATFIYQSPQVGSTTYLGSVEITNDASTKKVLVTTGVVSAEATVRDQYGSLVSGATVLWSHSGRNTSIASTTATTNALGKTTYSYTDASTSATSLTDTVSISVTAGNSGSYATESTAFTFVTALAATTVTAVAQDADGEIDADDSSASWIVTVTGASGEALSGYPVVVSGMTNTYASSTTVYTSSTGTATITVYGKLAGTDTLTFTSGGKTATGTIDVVAGASRTYAVDVTTVAMAPGDAPVVTVTVKDQYGNVVDGQTVNVTYAGTAGGVAAVNGVNAASGTTDANGQVKVTLGAAAAGTGTLTVKSTMANTSTSSVNGDGSAKPAKTASTGLTVTATITGVSALQQSVNATTAAAEAATDAAAEAIDAANAATDAANLAAEAADAATVAAEEARDAADAATAAVEELATQVATLMAALKAQITTLANTVAKIAKKVKA